MSKDWQKKELTYLKRYAETKTLEELADRFGTEVDLVRDKLTELGIRAKNSAAGTTDFYDDPVVDQYTESLKQMQAGKWKAAQKTLNGVVEASDLPEVTEKARQMLKVCAARLSEVEDASANDPFLLAVYQKNKGSYEEALKLCKKHGDDERFAYLEASVHALEEDADKALKSLTKATELNPKNRVYAYHDPDFESIRQQSELDTFFKAS